MKDLIKMLVEEALDELMEPREPTIYFDMDGVLANFEGSLHQSKEYLDAVRQFDDLAKVLKPELVGLSKDKLKQAFAGRQEDPNMAKLKKLWNKRRDVSYAYAGQPGFFRNLKMLPGAKEMMQSAADLTGKLPHILTAPMESSPRCAEEKQEWADDNLAGLFDDFHCTQDKHKYAHSEWDILIDDRTKFISKFREAGGTGIFYEGDPAATILQLEETIAKLKGMNEVSAIGTGGAALQSSGKVSGTGGTPLGKNMSKEHERMWSGDEPGSDKVNEERIGSRGSVDYFQMGSSLPDHLYNLTKDGKATRDPGLGGNTDKKKKNKREKKKDTEDKPGKRWYDK